MDSAVQLVLNRMHNAKDAAESVGLPAKAVQNIRKRVREERQWQEDDALAARALFTTQKKAKKARTASRAPVTKEKQAFNFRHTGHQVDVINKANHPWKLATIGGYKAATAEYQAPLKTKRKRGDGGADEIAEKYKSRTPPGLCDGLVENLTTTLKMIVECLFQLKGKTGRASTTPRTRKIRATHPQSHTATPANACSRVWALPDVRVAVGLRSSCLRRCRRRRRRRTCEARDADARAAVA